MPKSIALAEDDCDDQLLFTEALKQICKQSTLHAVPNARQLLEWLDHIDHELPDVVVMDVNMPGMSGIECLKIIRNTDRLNTLPVVVMSTSTDDETIDDAFRNGADSYAVKPGKFSDLRAVVEKIVITDWLAISSTRTRDNFLIKPHLAVR